MLRNLLLGCMLFVFCGCKEQAITLNLPEDRLIDVLVDLHLAEMMIKVTTESARDSLSDKIMHELYIIHDIDSTILATDLQTLASKPQEYYELSIKVAEKTKLLKEEYIESTTK